MKPILKVLALMGGLSAANWIWIDDAVARGARGGGGGFRGGGVRASGMSSINRGGGASFNRGSMASTRPSGAANRGMASTRPAGGRGGLDGANRPSIGGGDRPTAGTRPGSDGGRPGAGDRPNRPDRPDRPDRGDRERGDINIGSNNDINIDGDGDSWWGWDDHIDHPIAAGIGIGMVAGATAAAINSAYYYSLPGGCSPYGWGGYSYYNCGAYYLQPQYEGDTVVYVTVPDPKTASSAQTAPATSAPTGGPPPPSN